MNHFRNYRLWILFIALVVGLLIVQFRWAGISGSDWQQIIDGDGTGYFAYLNQIFITNNFGNAEVDFNRILPADSQSIIKNYSGTALLMFPFFIGASIIADMAGIPVTEASEIIQKSISIAALFYLLLGLALISKLLLMQQVRRRHLILILLLFVFGTNLLTYVVLHPSTSHVYSFFAVSGFLWQFKKFTQSKRKSKLILSAVWLGLVFLIRPFNALIIIFILFFFDSVKDFFGFLKANKRTIGIAIIVFLLIISIQNLLWYLQSGHWFVDSYPNEGFYFLHPEFFRVLFGFRKGLFIYTPLLLLCLPALYFLFRRNKFAFFTVSLFLLLTAYFISAWWCWTYSDGFGMRPFIEFYPVFMLLLAIGFTYSKRVFQNVLLGAACVFVLLNLFQNYQYQQKIISAEGMSFEKYRKVFLKFDKKYSNCLGGCRDLPTYNRFNQKLIIESPLINEPLISEDTKQLSLNKNDFRYNPDNEFYFLFTLKNQPELYASNKSYVKIYLEKKDLKRTNINKTVLVVTISYRKDVPDFYVAYPLETSFDYPVNQWHPLEFLIQLPKIKHPVFGFKIYVWNKYLYEMWIKSVKVEIYRTA